MARSTTKQKSRMRFEQLNHLVDNVLQKIPTSHSAALFVCFRHARDGGLFRLSARRLADALGVHERTGERLIKELEAWKVIELVKREQGTIPKTYRITGEVSRVGTQTDPSISRTPNQRVGNRVG